MVSICEASAAHSGVAALVPLSAPRARHCRTGHQVVHVAAGVGRDVRYAAPGQRRGIRCPGIEAERRLVPGRGPAGIDAARARVVVLIAGLVALRRDGRAGHVVLVPHRLDQEGGEVGWIGHRRQAAGHELPDGRAIVSHRLRDDVGQGLVGQRRLDGAVGRAAHHEGIGAGPAGADIGQAVAVLVARAAVAGVVEHGDVAQRGIDEELLRGKIEGRARRQLRVKPNEEVMTEGLLMRSQNDDW